MSWIQAMHGKLKFYRFNFEAFGKINICKLKVSKWLSTFSENTLWNLPINFIW